MAYQKPNITQCIDGRNHSWMIVSEEEINGTSWEHRWCQKCGALTQVTYNEEGEAIAVMDDNGNHYLMQPVILSKIAK